MANYYPHNHTSFRNMTPVRGFGNGAHQWGGGNESSVIGMGNFTRQNGHQNWDTTNGDFNKTYQSGRYHRSETVEDWNTTAQRGEGNDSITMGSRNYIGQYGTENWHEALYVNSVEARVAGNCFVTVAERCGQVILKGAYYAYAWWAWFW